MKKLSPSVILVFILAEHEALHRHRIDDWMNLVQIRRVLAGQERFPRSDRRPWFVDLSAIDLAETDSP